MRRLIAKPGNKLFIDELCNKIKEISGLSITRTTPRTALRKCNREDLIIRYGVADDILNAREINSRESIINASCKPRAKSIFIENNIKTPRFKDTPLCIGRPRNHRKGERFYFCESSQQVKAARALGITYFQEFIPKVREYRIHTAHGKVLAVQEKVNGNREQPIWNRTNGFVFQVLPWNEIPRGLCPLSVKATAVLGLDFGAVDVLEDNDNVFYVCEVNTAPRLEGYTIDRYAEYFAWLFKSSLNVEHFTENKRYILRRENLVDQ